MKHFAQLHLLTSYPPSNLNRDDIGRPKTAIMGGCERLRISSQCLKQAWRTSVIFDNLIKGERTKIKGKKIYRSLTEGGIPEDKAKDWTRKIMEEFGKLDTKNIEHAQLVHFNVEEIDYITKLTDKIIQRKSEPTKDELQLLLQKNQSAIDIAMFGRMLAKNPTFNEAAAVQVAHAISVHRVVVEEDYFTAVDDLNKEHSGAAHIGETGFVAGLFYLYICVDRKLLMKNLSENKERSVQSLKALVESAATISPRGKQNSFASRARASYIRSELGDQQPRSLSVAFLNPVKGGDTLEEAIKKLEEKSSNMDKAYGQCADSHKSMRVGGKGTLQEIMEHVVEGING